jgi:hypothetical protein
MATVYAKNPAELVIQNPHKKPQKKMARTKRKRNKKGRYTSKRKNPSDFVSTGKNLFLQYGLAALASTGVVKMISVGLKKTGLNQSMKETVLIAGPAVGGILTSMFASKNNAIAQGVAGGMVLASVNRASDKFIGGNEDGSMADANLSASDLIVKEDGLLYDQKGNAIAKIDLPGATGSKVTQKALTAGFDTMSTPSNMLGDFEGYNGYESGEVWTP